MAVGIDSRVSVVVLTYERPRLLTACLESLAAQDYPGEIEIIVADDGSGPATAEVIERLAVRDTRVRTVRHEHQGIAATRNLGVAAATGDVVAIVADDYVLAPDYVTVAVRYLEHRPEASMVRFDMLPLHDNWGSRVSDCYYSASIWRRLETESLYEADVRHGAETTTLEAAGAAVFRAEVLEAVGPWDERYQRGEDTEHTMRLRRAGFNVHMLASGTVMHSYRRLPVDTLRKCFLTGTWQSQVFTWTQPKSVGGKMRTLGRALDRARRGGDSRWSVYAYIPWMLLFEVTFTLGNLLGRVKRKLVRVVRKLAGAEVPARQ